MANTQVQAAQLRALVSWYTSLLRGRVPEVALSELGPLVSPMLTHTGWRPDWAAIARRLLDSAIGSFETSDTGSWYKGVTAADVAAALRMLWGISEHPSSAAAVARRIGSSDKTVTGWASAFTSNEFVLTALGRQTLVAEPPMDVSALSVRPPLWDHETEEWPPPKDRARLVRALADTHGVRLDEPEAVRLMRQVVADHLRFSYYAHPSHSRFYKQLLVDALVYWQEQDRLSFRGRSRSELGSDGGHFAAIAVATQLFFYEFMGNPARTDAVLQVVTARRSVNWMLQLVADQTQDLEEGGVIRIRPGALAARAVAEVTTRPALVPVTSAPGRDDDAAVAFSGATALARAKRIRQETGAAKLELAQDYVRLRIGYHPAPVRRQGMEARLLDGIVDGEVHDEVSSDALLLTLADQAVHLMLMDLRETALLDQLGQAILSMDHSFAYRTLSWRNHGLMLSKLDRHQEGIRWVLRALSELSDLQQANQLSDHRAALEAAQQIALSAGGICIRVVEEVLLARPRERGHIAIEEYVRAGLGWSWSAVQRLEHLDTHEEGLSAERYDDMHIAWRGWRVQARVQRLRMQIVARAAIMGGLVSEEQLTGPAFDCSLQSIIAGYRQVVSTAELGPDSRDNVLIQAAWVAVLNGGRIPVDVDESPVLKDLYFMVTGPDQMEASNLEWVRFDFDLLRTWLVSNPVDLGVLRMLPLRGRLAKELDRSSGNVFLQWRSVLPNQFER